MRFSRFAPKKEERSRFGTIARKALSISAEDKVSEKTQQFTTALRGLQMKCSRVSLKYCIIRTKEFWEQ